MGEKDISINLANGKFENKVINLSEGDGTTYINFSNDVEGQLQWKTDGDDIVITAYGTQEGGWTNVVYNVSYITKGKYKGKYKVVETVGKYDYENEEFIGKTFSKTTYTKTPNHFDGDFEFVQADKNGKIYYIATGNPININATTIASSEILGTVRIKGANLLVGSGSLYLTSDTYKEYIYGENDDIEIDDKRVDLLNKNYFLLEPKKNKYTGSWTNDICRSYFGNETFDLKTGNDIIFYTGGNKFGKDTVILNKDSHLSLYASDKVLIFKRSGNDVIASVNKFIGTNYDAKVYCTVYSQPEAEGENAGKYHVNAVYYDIDINGYSSDSTSSYQEIYMTLDDIKKYGLKIGDSVKLYLETERNNLGTITSWINHTKNQSDIYKQEGTVNLKDYFKIGTDNVYILSEDEDDNPIYDSIIQKLYNDDVYMLGNPDSKKKQTLTGTFLSESILSGKKNDKITTGSGGDYITGSKGNDTIYINGSGEKEFYKDTNLTGTTTISFDKNMEFVDEYLNKLVTLNIYNIPQGNKNNAPAAFCKSGNDLIIDNDAALEIAKRQGVRKNLPKPLKDKTIIKDYFNSDGLVKNAVTFGENKTLEEFMLDDYPINAIVQIGKANKKNTLYDTDSVISDYIIGGNKKDTIIVSNKGSDRIISLKGNDTIKFENTATGEKSILSSVYDGNDTIIIAQGASDLQINVGSDAFAYNIPNETTFEKTGNDLVYKTFIKKQKNEDITIKKAVTNKVTIKDYFSNEYDVKFIADFESNTVKSLPDALGDGYLKVNGVYEKSLKETLFIGTEHNNSYTYNGKGTAFITDETGGNDKYNLKLTSKTNLYVCEKNGDDSIIFSSDVKNMRLFFDVTLSDNYEIPPTTGNDLYVFNSKSLTSKGVQNAKASKMLGAVSFTGHFIRESGTPTFQSSKGEFNMNSWINSVKSDVVSWLENSNGKYSSTDDVFASENKADINALIKVYTNGKYNIG